MAYKQYRATYPSYRGYKNPNMLREIPTSQNHKINQNANKQVQAFDFRTFCFVI